MDFTLQTFLKKVTAGMSAFRDKEGEFHLINNSSGNLHYDEFTEKWEAPIKWNNPSIPILVKPNIFNTKEML
ncbi:hypothetical protein A6J59_002995 [Pasteurella multocida]|nr:hypothetical protein A6J59_002995 [Pasteurella multocida]